jgi:hypothetical protein
MKENSIELVLIVAGMVLLCVGLSAWLGWERATVVIGALLLLLGMWGLLSDVRVDRGS